MRRSVALALALFAVTPGCARLEELRAKRQAGSAVAPSGAPVVVVPPAVSASSVPVASRADAAAPPSPAAPKKPAEDLNVILLSVDSLRADMPWAGYERPIAPNLTALEKRAVSYTRGYAVSSYTSMSLGGLLAGKLPRELRRDGFFFGTYHKDNVFFPELLQRAGVRTMGAHAHGYFKSGGFQQGFDKWVIVPNLKWDNTTDLNVTAPQHEAIAEKLLGDPALDEARFFAWFHFLDPHDQYVSHESEIPAWGRSLRDRYDGEVTFTDKYIGRLLEFIASRPYASRTAIIVTADHGEALGEHKQFAHGFELWENLVHVPLFFVLPGVEARHIDVARSGIDLAPTICELMGVLPDPGFEGKSLVSELYGTASAEPRDIALDLPTTSDSDRRRAVLHDHLKFVAYGENTAFHLYDLAADPGETSPITKGPDYDAMRARYFAFEKTVKDVQPYACLPKTCLNGAYKKPKGGGI